MIGDECFVGDARDHQPVGEDLPVQDGRGRARSSRRRSCGRARARARCSAGAGVRGLANVDITSEVAVRLAMAYGTALKKGSVVCTSRDTSRSARALKRAIIAGLNLSGVHVMDLELSTVPLTRFQVRTRAGAGRDHGAARVRRPRQRRDPLHRRERRRHRRGRAAQDRAPALPRGLPPRVRGRHRRHRVPAESDRVLHGRARGERATASGSASARSRSCSTTRSARRRS